MFGLIFFFAVAALLIIDMGIDEGWVSCVWLGALVALIGAGHSVFYLINIDSYSLVAIVAGIFDLAVATLPFGLLSKNRPYMPNDRLPR